MKKRLTEEDSRQIGLFKKAERLGLTTKLEELHAKFYYLGDGYTYTKEFAAACRKVNKEAYRRNVMNIANEITNTVQIPYQYYEGASILVMNNSFGPDSAQEYTVYKKGAGSFHAVESLTVSWMIAEEVAEVLHQIEDTSFEQLEVIPLLGLDSTISSRSFKVFKREHNAFASSY